MAEYYTRKGYAKTLGNSKYKRIFGTMVTLGYGTGAYNGKETTRNKFYKVISAYYDIYEKMKDGEYVQSLVAKRIKEYNEKKKPVIGHFTAPNKDGHSMVIVGYYDITVSYQKTKQSKVETKTVRYYVVNDGWSYATSGGERISYVRDTYLKSITKIK